MDNADSSYRSFYDETLDIRYDAAALFLSL